MITKLRPPIKWHGGKFYLWKHIVQHFPAHHTYVEPYGGAASVLLNKPESPVEVYNDINGRLTRLFRVIRDQSEEFQKRLQLTPYSEIEFNEAMRPVGQQREIELARRDFVRWRLSLGGRGDSFSQTKHRSRRGMADVVSGFLSAIDEQLPLIAERFRSVQILEKPAIDVIDKWDSPETLFYCDPPYLPDCRASKDVYEYEMTADQHEELLRYLINCQGHVVISGYPSGLYSDMLADWSRIEFDIANHSAGGKSKKRKQEVLWLKPSQHQESDSKEAE